MPERVAGPAFPKHFDGKHFFNPDAPQGRGLSDVLRWKLTSRADRSPAFLADVKPTVPRERLDEGALRITLVNHSTVLIQAGACNILTDPIWSDRASPFSWAGPKRKRIPGVRLEDLPPLDILLISHNHYDHLDLRTLGLLAARKAGSSFVTPLGVGRLFGAKKLLPVYEMDWGDVREFGEVSIHSVPAIHFASRGLFDRNKTLWCGYVIEFRRRRVYFAGDTAFGDHFAQIRERFGPPHAALLPIGAYRPRWFMSPIHMSPEDALAAHGILGSRLSIGIHHGTFQLADDGIDVPKLEISKASPPDPFRILANGESADVAPWAADVAP